MTSIRDPRERGCTELCLKHDTDLGTELKLEITNSLSVGWVTNIPASLQQWASSLPTFTAGTGRQPSLSSRPVRPSVADPEWSSAAS